VAFNDNDPLEDDMGVRCQDMTPDQLVAYIKSYQSAFGLNLRVEGLKERAVFKGLQRVYGKANAGNIVKWAFYHHRGRFRDEPIGFFLFSKGNKWWTDKLYMEMQEEQAKARQRTATGASLGITSLADL
jgi:hypothetical protein